MRRRIDEAPGGADDRSLQLIGGTGSARNRACLGFASRAVARARHGLQKVPEDAALARYDVDLGDHARNDRQRLVRARERGVLCPYADAEIAVTPFIKKSVGADLPALRVRRVWTPIPIGGR